MRRALIIGIDEYPTAPLHGCVNDALAIKALLSRHEDDAVNFGCKVLTAPTDRITKRILRENIGRLFAHEADIALLYFSGHGTETNLGGYLVTPDAASYDEGISLSDILTLANASKTNEVVIILDSCFSGAFGTVPAMQNDHANLREGVSILTASRSTQTASETPDGHGVFTNLLCGALEGGAADVLGDVTVASIYAYIDQALGPWDQRPLFKAHVSKLTQIRKCKPPVSLETLRKLPEWFETPDSAYRLDISYEPMPYGKAKPEEERNREHEEIFNKLQALRAAKIVVPCGEEHMYFAAINDKSCALTLLGKHYWRLVYEGRI